MLDELTKIPIVVDEETRGLQWIASAFSLALGFAPREPVPGGGTAIEAHGKSIRSFGLLWRGRFFWLSPTISRQAPKAWFPMDSKSVLLEKSSRELCIPIYAAVFLLKRHN